MTDQMPGLPYRGWSLPQVTVMLRKASQFLNDERADQMTALSMAAQSVVSKKAGSRLARAVERLRGRLRRRPDRTGPADSDHEQEDED